MSYLMRLLSSLNPGTDTTTGRESPSIAPEAAYNILRNDRRRRVVEFLAQYDAGETIAVSSIADSLAEQGDDRTAAYVSLIQSHLLRLDPEVANGVMNGERLVVYDERGKTVEVRPELHRLHEAHQGFESALK